MTSTYEFIGGATTLTLHRPPGSQEAVLMIEAMDSVASITLPDDQVRKLAAALLAPGEEVAPTAVHELLGTPAPAAHASDEL